MTQRISRVIFLSGRLRSEAILVSPTTSFAQSLRTSAFHKGSALIEKYFGARKDEPSVSPPSPVTSEFHESGTWLSIAANYPAEIDQAHTGSKLLFNRVRLHSHAGNSFHPYSLNFEF